MRQGIRLAALILMTLAACEHKQTAKLTKPDAFAEQISLQPAQNGALQRIALPPIALSALQRFDLGDVRIFDAHDRLVPIALIPEGADAQLRTVSVPVYPILHSVNVPEQAALSVRVAGGARVVTVDAPASDEKAPQSDAALLDTRALDHLAVAIELVTEIPPDRPLTLTFWQSANLRDWEPLADTTLFRAATETTLLGASKITLPGVNLKGRYVKISWRGATDAKVTSTKVVLSAAPPTRRIAVATTPLTLVDAHELEFDLPILARLSGMRIVLRGSDDIMPVKLYGRPAAEQPWALLAANTLRAGSSGSVLDIKGQPLPHYRLVVDSRTTGFSAAPKIDLLVQPVELLANFVGTPPYRLAVGQAAASPNYLALNEIAPDTKLAVFRDLPQAAIIGVGAARPVIAIVQRPGASTLEPRKLALWAILLAGTGVLALAVVKLMQHQAIERKSIS